MNGKKKIEERRTACGRESEQTRESERDGEKKERWEFGMFSTACEQQKRRRERESHKRET